MVRRCWLFNRSFFTYHNVFPENTSAKGQIGLRSNQILSRNKQTINSELLKSDVDIIHIGSNDVSKGVKLEKITGNVHFVCKRLKE